MISLLLICGLLTLVILGLSIKILLMKKAADKIQEEFCEKLKNDTNTLISIPPGGKAMSRLADDINVELRELRRQRHRFLQGDLELKTAVTNISHDLRTPLTAINAYLELLDKTEKSESADRYIRVIKNRTEVLEQLTDELFRYSVITSPDYDTLTGPVLVNNVLEESILAFYAALQEHNIIPDIHITEQKVIRTLNRAALSRIFENLLNNALKYSDGDLDITLTETGEIKFSNTASGLNDVEVERLFNRFYTLENARKSTGLGLSISKILVDQMNGDITARYENGRLVICIHLPPDS